LTFSGLYPCRLQSAVSKLMDRTPLPAGGVKEPELVGFRKLFLAITGSAYKFAPQIGWPLPLTDRNKA
jgi:hypothetical protein